MALLMRQRANCIKPKARGEAGRLRRRGHAVKSVHTVQDNPVIRVNKSLFREEDYLATQQSGERAEWAKSVRNLTRRERHMLWKPELDPPPLLSQVSVILLSPRRPTSTGTVARACSAFEVEDLRIVAPRCSHLTRHALGSSRGAQYLLHSAQTFQTVREATADCDLTVAFTRWAKSQDQPFYDLVDLVEHPLVKQLVSAEVGSSRSRSGMSEDVSSDKRGNSSSGNHVSERQGANCTATNDYATASGADAGWSEGSTEASSSVFPDIVSDLSTAGGSMPDTDWSSSTSTSTSASSTSSSSDSTAHGIRTGSTDRTGPRVALVFGREDLGMSDEEVLACDVVCSIPIGRLQESLSLSHAVSITLSSLFQRRLQSAVKQKGALS